MIKGFGKTVQEHVILVALQMAGLISYSYEMYPAKAELVARYKKIISDIAEEAAKKAK